MEIIVGKTAGFCYGVERAVEGAKEELKKTKEPIFCLGEIVHNRQVIEQLEQLGVSCVETLEEVKGKILIRAHGIPKEIYDMAKRKGIQIQDFTCPNVIKVHKIVEKFAKEGYFIFLLGAKNHPENIGTLSYCGNDFYIFEKQEELPEAMEAFTKTNKKKLLLISQTTYSIKKFNQIEKEIKNKINQTIEFVVKNTICQTTQVRQKETEKLSKQVDSMIIIGGKKSSNTKKLYEIAKKNCAKSFLIETVDELELPETIQKIGIMAGASTPKESIEEVLKEIKRRYC